MKKMLVTILLLILISCSNNLHKQEVVNREVEYFTDNRVGLCYAMIQNSNGDGGSTRSFTCVPCDSVKNLIP
jgi:hypothetical protein